ncbi:MAG: hypothetical protein EP343_07230 [Deltaproteobacteria bacterium]|nr:MAG: hypothetical protein EP343_07230 [Deltaproteobacteria bacterium]
MDVRCTQCNSTYELDESQMPKDSARVKCSSCGHVFRIFKQGESLDATIAVEEQQPSFTSLPEQEAVQESSPPPASPSATLDAPIMVRSENGVLLQIPDQATLQRMIVQRKLSPIDELSYDNEAWHRLGTLEDLQPFFQLLMQATPSQASVSGPVMIAGQLDPTSTLEFGLPSSYDPSLFPPSGHASNPPQGIRHNTARYQEAAMGSAEYSRPQLPVGHAVSSPSHDMVNREELPFTTAPPAPIFTSSQEGMFAPGTPGSSSTAAYGTSFSSSDRNAVVSPPQEVAYRTLEPLQHEPIQGSPQPSNGNDQRKIPTLITRSADDWALGPMSLPSHESMSGLPRLPEDNVERPASRSSVDSISVQRSPSLSSQDKLSVSQDDLFADSSYTPSTSRSGRWLVLIILLLGLGLGSYSLFNPNVFGTIAYMVRLQEAPPQAMEKVSQVRTQMQQVSPASFTNARKSLLKLESDLGHPFTELLATQASLSYLQMDVIRLRYRLMEKKQEYWEKQRQQLASAKTTPTDDDDKDNDDDDKAGAKKKPSSLKQLKQILEQWTQQKQNLDKKYKKLWKSADGLVRKSRKLNPQHPYTQLAILHRQSFSSNRAASKDAATKKSKDSTFEKRVKQALQKITDGCHQGWIYLNSASVLIRQGNYKKGLKHVQLATERCNHDRWLYPRFLKVLAHTELQQNKLALKELESIRKEHPEHPLLQEFSNVLQPGNLKLLLELHQEKKPETRKPAPRRGEPKAPETRKPETRKPETRQPEARKPENRIINSGMGPQARNQPPQRRKGRATPPRPRKVAKKSSRKSRKIRSANLRACGSYQASRGSKRKALRYALQRIKTRKSGFLYSSIGWCYFDLGNSRKAVTWFRKATRVRGFRNDTYYGMGLAFNKMGQRKSACDSLRQQLRRYPRYKDNIEIRALYKDIKCSN